MCTISRPSERVEIEEANQEPPCGVSMEVDNEIGRSEGRPKGRPQHVDDAIAAIDASASFVAVGLEVSSGPSLVSAACFQPAGNGERYADPVRQY
jgi:hypothetical protein